MQTRNLCRLWCILSLGAAHLSAQEATDAQKFSQQMKQMQETFEKQQREMRDHFERRLREQQLEIDALKGQLATRTNLPALLGVEPASSLDRKRADALASGAVTPVQTEPWSPTAPIRIGTAQNYINLSLDGLFAAGTSTAGDIGSLQLGGHDPSQRGFTLQNLEAVFEGRVDPYFRGQANVIFLLSPEGETVVEAEEAYLETMSLPWNLQVRGGQFFTEFGRLNVMHPHAWDFVDQPLVNGRFLGGDGLRNPGARISWLAPTPFYSELFLNVQNSQGETAHSFRNDNEDEPLFGRPVSQGKFAALGDLLFAPRYAASFDLTGSQTIVAGTSAAFGPNGTGNGGNTEIYGVDLFWKWKSPSHHAGFPFVTWQTEAMMRRFKADAFAGDDENPALPAETLTDYGFYSQLAYGFKKGWVAALRGDYLFPDKQGRYESIAGFDPDRASRWRISPNLTYYPSEFSKIRLQYNFDKRNRVGEDHSVWLQWEFLLGAHAAHRF